MNVEKMDKRILIRDIMKKISKILQIESYLIFADTTKLKNDNVDSVFEALNTLYFVLSDS